MSGAQADSSGIALHVIPALGTPAFADTLVSGLQGVAFFDLSAVIGFPIGTSPLLLHDGLGPVSGLAMRNYIKATYVLDAVYVACREGVADGLYRLSELAPDNFFESGYYNSPEVHPCISLQSGALAEEIIFITQAKPGYFICLSLMRSHAHERFSDAELARLKGVLDIILVMLRKHWGGGDGVPQARPQAMAEMMDQAFATFRHEALSEREQHVVSLMLRGHSSLSIASVPGIAEGTVKNHRKHIYAKLGISSQGELFADFVRHALRQQ